MTRHLTIPNTLLEKGCSHPAHEEYLRGWRDDAVRSAERGDVAASTCLQAAFIDFALDGKPVHDWIGVMEDLLSDDNRPLAYSEVYASRLSGFGNQFQQMTVHSIHARWWIEQLRRPENVDHDKYADLILSKKQTDGLIYDHDVSETILRHRMKSELTMSMAMAVEILQSAHRLNNSSSLELATSLVDPRKCPPLGYMGMEYFRLHALRNLGQENLFPVGIAENIAACAVQLEVGWCDFSITSKVDAYMGTAKRTQRDKPIHSPLTACHVESLAGTLPSSEPRAEITDRLSKYACHLKRSPMDIPAFQMRDVPIPFGADRTPIEAICASRLIASCQNT